jgi:hypothetical protein
MNAPGPGEETVSGGLVLGVVITRLVLAVMDCGASPEDVSVPCRVPRGDAE